MDITNEDYCKIVGHLNPTSFNKSTHSNAIGFTVRALLDLIDQEISNAAKIDKPMAEAQSPVARNAAPPKLAQSLDSRDAASLKLAQSPPAASTPLPSSPKKANNNRGRRLFSVQIEEGPQLHKFPICEFDDPGTIAHQIMDQFRDSVVKLEKSWGDELVATYWRKKMRREEKDRLAS